MFRINFRIAFRNLLKNKGYTAINVIGLATGIMSVLFIMLWVRDELSYDKYYKNSRNIYRIYWQDELPQTRTPHPMTYAMVNDFPEVVNAVSLTPVWGPGLTQPDRLIKYSDKWFEENRIYAADTTFFEIFDFPLMEGNPRTALKDVGSLVITQSMARKYFGDEEPLGKMITINFGRDANFRITGVMKDIPHNTHFHFDFLISYNTLKAYETGEWFTWGDFGHYNYIVLRDNADPKKIENEMVNWITKYVQVNESQLNSLKRGDMGFRLQPVSDIHLYSNLKWELEPNGDISYVYIFSALGILILLIACINFINLSIARTTSRLVEIGIKKLSGAGKFHIMLQFLSESFIVILLAFIVAIIMFELLSQTLGNITSKSFNIDPGNPATVFLILGIIILCSVFAGIYPAIVLSKLSPSGILKGRTTGRFRSSGLGYFLLVFQFAVSVFLIIVVQIISGQTRLLQEKKLGFDSNEVLAVPIKDSLVQRNYEFVKSRILNNSHVQSITAVSNIPGRNFNQNPIQWKGSDDTYSASELKVDEDFFNTLHLRILEGRGFSKDIPSDYENAFILNKTAASLFKWKSSVNEDLIWYDDEITRTGKVIGVVEDFHFQSLHSGIEPLIIQLYRPDFNYFLIRISSSGIPETMKYLKSTFEKLDPSHPYTYFFLDDDFARLYQGEIRMQKVTGYFTFLALLISCVGLFGLSSFAIEKRTKEIGIRKVNGASVFNITGMLSGEFVRWVIISFIIACPVAWIFSRQWLNHFAEKIGISWSVFITAGMISLVLSLFTVFYHAWKAAVRNPVDTLRYE